jgi:hypothetical protein
MRLSSWVLGGFNLLWTFKLDLIEALKVQTRPCALVKVMYQSNPPSGRGVFLMHVGMTAIDGGDLASQMLGVGTIL